MKIVDIIPRQICVKIEISKEDTQSLLDFFEKCMPLYVKVYSDSVTDDSLSVPTEFNQMLASILKEIKEGDSR